MGDGERPHRLVGLMYVARSAAGGKARRSRSQKALEKKSRRNRIARAMIGDCEPVAGQRLLGHSHRHCAVVRAMAPAAGRQLRIVAPRQQRRNRREPEQDDSGNSQDAAHFLLIVSRWEQAQPGLAGSPSGIIGSLHLFIHGREETSPCRKIK